MDAEAPDIIHSELIRLGADMQREGLTARINYVFKGIWLDDVPLQALVKLFDIIEARP